MQMYPMKMHPVFRDYLWGGQLLKEVYRKKSKFEVTAESWELSALEAADSVIAEGIYAGLPFGRWIFENPGAVGSGASPGAFPVLVKFLDANQPLSVQVHPSDKNALFEAGEKGKAEVWYIVAAKPGGYIYYGLNREVTREEFSRRIADKTVLEILNKVEVQPGQVWSITPGIVHSAGGGVLVAEVQQSSDTTFRVYDFDRKDKEGRERELHLDRALQVMGYKPILSHAGRANVSFATRDYVLDELFSCKYFKLRRLHVQTALSLFSSNASFHSLLFISGSGSISHQGASYGFSAGDSFFIPAGMGEYELFGQAVCLLTTL